MSTCLGRYREPAIVLLLTVLAFAVRVQRIDFNSLSEDESAKWAAIQEYRQGHFAGVNSEHPMLPKTLSWTSLAGLASYAQRAVRYSRCRSSLSVVPHNDGTGGVFCCGILLGNRASAGGVESTHEGRNTIYVFHLAGLLLLQSGAKGGYR